MARYSFAEFVASALNYDVLNTIRAKLNRNLPTDAEADALAAANSPSSSNALATMNDIGSTTSATIWAANQLDVGQETIPRMLATSSVPNISGTMRLTYFTARKSETVGSVRLLCGGTAASGTTLCRIGLYSIDGSDNATLIASTANDTSLFASTHTAYTPPFTSPVAIVTGNRYALAVLWAGGTPPTLWGIANSSEAFQEEAAFSPRLSRISAESDLPGTSATGNPGMSMVYAVLLPGS